MTVLYKTLKNSNVNQYVKDRVLNDNLEYLLSNGVQTLLNSLTIPLESEQIVVWGDGSIEVSIYSDIYVDHEEYFKDSEHERESLKGIDENSSYYLDNKDVFVNIKSKVQQLLQPMNRLLAFEFFGVIKESEGKESSGKIKCNATRLHFNDGNGYVEIMDEKLIPRETLVYLNKVEQEELERVVYG